MSWWNRTRVDAPSERAGGGPQKEVQRFYDRALGASCINWDRLSGGCEFRAEAATRWFTPSGVTTMKIWCFPHVVNMQTETGLRTVENFPLTPSRQPLSEEGFSWGVDWGFHVAPACLFASNGRLVAQVIDPALLDGPCTVGRWLWVLGAPNGRWMLTPTEVTDIDPKTFAFSSRIGDDDLRRTLAGHFDGELPALTVRVPARGEGDGATYLD